MFKKYVSIENDYNIKTLNYLLEKYPEAKETFWVIQEKIHGSNFSIYFTNNNGEIDIKYGRRTDILLDDEKFYNYQSIKELDEIKDLIHNTIMYMRNENINFIIIYGELCGANVQKEVYYYDDVRLLVFDMIVDNKWLTFADLSRLLCDKFRLPQLLVPIIGIVFGIQNALNIDTRFDSKVSLKENNLCEGVVIKPLDKIFISNDNPIYIKKKNREFLEKKSRRDKEVKVFDSRITEYIVIKPLDKIFISNDNPIYIKKKNREFLEKKSRRDKEVKVFDSRITEYKEAFKDYVNENRLNSAFSKYGMIEDRKDIGKYIKIIYDDCLEDFLKDYDLSGISDKDKKHILNINPYIAQLLLTKL